MVTGLARQAKVGMGGNPPRSTPARAQCLLMVYRCSASVFKCQTRTGTVRQCPSAAQASALGLPSLRVPYVPCICARRFRPRPDCFLTRAMLTLTRAILILARAV